MDGSIGYQPVDHGTYISVIERQSQDRRLSDIHEKERLKGHPFSLVEPVEPRGPTRVVEEMKTTTH